MATRKLARGLTIGLVAAAVLVAAVTARSDAGPSRRPGDGDYRRQSPQPEVVQRPDGTWVSPRLPFAGPFPDRVAAERAVQQARDQGLIA